MNRLIVALAMISLSLLCNGCGQSGPLYLPGNPSTIQTVPGTPEDAEQEDAEEEEQEDGDAP